MIRDKSSFLWLKETNGQTVIVDCNKISYIAELGPELFSISFDNGDAFEVNFESLTKLMEAIYTCREASRR